MGTLRCRERHQLQTHRDRAHRHTNRYVETANLRRPCVV